MATQSPSKKRTRREPIPVAPRRRPNGRRRFVNYPRFGRTGLRRWIPSWKLLFGAFVFGILALIGAFAAAVAMTTIPDPNAAASAEKTIIYWNNGKDELGRIGDANRVSIPLSQMPDNLQKAVLAAEDKEFYEHGGADPTAMARMAWNVVQGGEAQGASTITQQYAKNTYLTQDQTIDRKVREILLSVKLETEVSKDDILTGYLNTIYFGRGAYGVQTASLQYFGKDAEDLKLNEAAVLAAIIRAPGGYDPENHKDKLQMRFDYVLDGMVEKGWITQKQRDNQKLPKFTKYKGTATSMTGTNGYLLAAVQRELVRNGFTEEQINQGGMRVTTTFDKAEQEAAVDAVKNQGLGSDPTVHIGLTSVNTENGEIVAMYGGKDYATDSYSDSDLGQAQAGSTFKAFTLAAALEQGIKLDSQWDGSSPRTFGKGADPYELKNEGNQSYGRISLLQATERSVNTVFVDVTDTIGPDKVIDAAKRAGLSSGSESLDNPTNVAGWNADSDLSVTLGNAAPTTVGMASAYATFANGGKHITPVTVKEVRTLNGDIKYQHVVDEKRVFDEDIANTVNYALSNVVQNGTGTAAQGIGRTAAGKTGTTDGGMSAWFVGYVPQRATAVSMTRMDASRKPISLDGTGGYSDIHGGGFPARVWTSFMSDAVDDLPEMEFGDPSDELKGNDYQRYYNPNPSPSASNDKKKKPGQSPSASQQPAQPAVPVEPVAPPANTGAPSGGNSGAPPA